MVKWKYIGSLLRLYIYIYTFKMSKIYNRIVHEYKCLFLALSSFKLRESGKQNLGVKGKNVPKLLILFFWRGSTGEFLFFHGLIDLVLFLMLAWGIFGVPRVSVFLSLARSKMAIVRLPRDLSKNYLFCIYFRWGEGNPTSVWGPPTNHLASFSLSPSDVRRPTVT